MALTSSGLLRGKKFRERKKKHNQTPNRKTSTNNEPTAEVTGLYLMLAKNRKGLIQVQGCSFCCGHYQHFFGLPFWMEAATVFKYSFIVLII